MNLVSIFPVKMPLQILYLSVGFKKHLSNKALSRLRILKGALAEHCRLQGLLPLQQEGAAGASPWPHYSTAQQNTTICPLVPWEMCSSNQKEMPVPENRQFSFSATVLFLLMCFDQ